MITSGTKDKLIADLAMANLDPGKIYVLEVKEKPKKTSQNARGYYWALLHKYAIWTHKSDTYWHNSIMERFGEDAKIGETTACVPLPEGVNYLEYPKAHLKWTGKWEMRKGKRWYWYIMKMESKYYDSKQFSRLIDGLVEEIEGSGAPIQTMTPRELEALKGYETAT